MKKRLISLLLALVMLLACAPAMADSTDPNGAGLDVVILIDRSGTMPRTDPDNIALAATKMFADRCNSQDNSVAIVPYGYNVLIDDSEFEFYDLSRDGKVDQLRRDVDASTIKDRNEDTNTGEALKYAYDKILERRASFPNHKFAILVISDGQIDIGDSEAFKAEYPGADDALVQQLIAESKAVGQAAAEQCAQDGIPVYCLGIYSDQSNILGEDMNNWSAATQGMYEETSNINDVYNIIREMYLHMTGNPEGEKVENGRFTIPDNALEANVEIVPSVSVSKMTLTRPDGSQVDLSGNDLNVKIREDAQYTMVKLMRPEAGEWTLTFADGLEHNLTVYVTCNLDLSMMFKMPESVANYTPVTIELEAKKQKAVYGGPNQPANLTITHAATGTTSSAAMTWNAGKGVYEYQFTPVTLGEYRFHAEIQTSNMTNVTEMTDNNTQAVLKVVPRPITVAQPIADQAFIGHLVPNYANFPITVSGLRSHFSDPDLRGIVNYEVSLSENDFITVTADIAADSLTVFAQKATAQPVTVTVRAIDALNEYSEPLTFNVAVEDAQQPIALNPNMIVPAEPIKIRAMLPQKQGQVVLTDVMNYFVENNAIDGEYVESANAAEEMGSQLLEVYVANNELVVRGLEAGSTRVLVTGTSSDGSSISFTVDVEVENLLTIILMIIGGVLLLLVLIALVIWAVVQANKPLFTSMASLTITLCGDDEYDGTDMLHKYGKRKVKLSEVCRKAAMHTGSFGAYLDKITIRPKKNGILVQCAIKNVPHKEFTLHPYDARTIDVDPANAYSIKLEYYEAD